MAFASLRKVFRFVGVPPGSWGENLLAIACAVAVVPLSAVVYKYVELPVYRWTSKLLTRPAKVLRSAR